MGVPESKLVLGKHSGRHALAKRCEDLGCPLNREQLDEMYRRFTAMAEGFDPKTGYILREKYKGMGQGGPFDGECDLSDWHAADGVTLPYKHQNKQNGQQTSTAEFKKVEFNPKIDPKMFDKPADAAAGNK